MVEFSKHQLVYWWNQYHLLDWITLTVLYLIGIIVTASVKPYCRTFLWTDATIAYPAEEDTFPTYSLALMLAGALAFYVFFVWYLVRPLQDFLGEPLEWYAIGDAAATAGGAASAYASVESPTAPAPTPSPAMAPGPRRPRVRDMQTGRGPLYPWLRAQLWAFGLEFSVMAVLKVYAGRLRPDYLSRLKVAGYTSATHGAPEPQTNPQFYCDLMDAHPALREGRLSFPSGHSSTSFTVFTVLALFLVAHLRPFARHASFTRLMICLVPLIVPAMCAVSRTRNNKHHFADIVAGSLIGITSALLCFCGSFRPVGGAANIYFARTAGDVEYDLMRDGSGAVGTAMTAVGGAGDRSEGPSEVGSGNYQATGKREDSQRRRPASPATRVDDSAVTLTEPLRRPTGLTERRLNEDPAAVPWI